jgi:hypothetical protein
MNLNYTTGIPDTPNNPSNDQPSMKINTNSINSIIQIDHHGFVDNLGGYHTIIHQDSSTRSRSGQGNTFTNFPAAIPSINQLFSAQYTPDTTGGVADTQLFTQTGSGQISQLTGFLAASDGWQWIGGTLIQWGSVTTTSSSGSVTFKDRVAGAIPFPNNCWNVSITLSFSSSPGTFATIGVRSLNRLGFDWRAVVPSAAHTDGFYWTAIGS